MGEQVHTSGPTPAGAKLLAEFVRRERRGALPKLTHGYPPGLPLPRGDGGALAAAQKLAREGFAELVGGRHRRFLIATEAGRAAISLPAPAAPTDGR